MAYDVDGYEPDEEDRDDSDCHVCAHCLDAIPQDGGAVLVMLCLPHFADEVHYFPLLDDETGEPEVEPLFFHLDCWDEVLENIEELTEDEPPVEEPDSMLTCDCCQSSIRMGERVATISTGEFEKSQRLGGLLFIENEVAPDVMCLPCASRMADAAEIDPWTHINQNGECYTCMRARCWRKYRCTCDCHD